MLGHGRGGYADFVMVKPSEMAVKPSSIDIMVAAAVPLAAMTAWQDLFDQSGVIAGQRVLIHGGAGAVGHLAIQFAQAEGAFVATTAFAEDAGYLRGLGADQVVDYKSELFESLVQPVDVVYDLIGEKTQQRS